jgi:hypothetical protein
LILTRRDFLKAGIAAALTPGASFAVPPRAFSFAFFSDTHLALGRNERECRAMMEEIASGIRPDFAVNGGDVTDYGWRGEYEGYARVLAGMTFPVHHVPGNHDVRWSPLGPRIFGEFCGEPFRAFSHKGCRFVLLDSSVPLSTGAISRASSSGGWSASCAAAGRDTPVFVFTTTGWGATA